MNQILNRIRTAYPDLAPSKKKVASYFMNHYSTVFLDTVTELAEKIGVSDTTIINFCSDLGFHGYSDFRRAIRSETFSGTMEEQEREELPPGEQELAAISDSVTDGIRKTFHSAANAEAFYKAADLLGHAGKIYCVGFWSFSGFVKTEALNLNRAGYHAEAVYPDMGGFIDQIRWADEKDVALVYDCARYLTALTEICTILKERGVRLILITDTGPCPRLSLADVVIRCESGDSGDYRSKHTATTVSAVSHALEVLLRKYSPRPEDVYDSKVREGVFTRFNPYGVIEPDAGNKAPEF